MLSRIEWTNIGNAVNITDADGDRDLLTLDVTASSGSLRVPSLVGIRWVKRKDSRVVIVGPIARIQSSLTHFEYKGPLNRHGNFTVGIKLVDAAGEQADHNLIISVKNINDAPVVHRPTHILRVNESMDLSLFQ